MRLSEIASSGGLEGVEQQRQELKIELRKEMRRENERKVEKAKAELRAELEAKYEAQSAELAAKHKNRVDKLQARADKLQDDLLAVRIEKQKVDDKLTAAES